MNYVVLVNKNNLIKYRYFKYLELEKCSNICGNEVKLEKSTLLAFNQLREYLLRMDIEIGIDTAYRSLEEQQQIIDEFKKKYGDDYTRFVAPLRASEHHTALAIDISIKKDGKFLTDNDDLFSNEEIFKEICKHLHKFGFILRYPMEKEKVTGYSYEPWHIRYVGVVPATVMYSNQLTLEEYLTNFSGVLLVNKEPGMTSRDVVNEVSKILGIKKIGHTGTLDPMAEGVLVLTIGKATKLGEILTSKEKEYVAEVDVGYLTDTLDSTGKIIKKKELTGKIDYENLLNSFNKTYFQEVPIYSAIKVNGKKLYEYARENKQVELPKKEVNIEKIELLDKKNNSFKFKCLVSKGTYIRSLIRDMGIAINEYFTMTSLVRTKQGCFEIKDSYTLNNIRKNEFEILKIEDVLDYKTIVVGGGLLKMVRNGAKIKNIWNIKDRVVFKDRNSELLVIYVKDGDQLKIDKMVYNYFI